MSKKKIKVRTKKRMQAVLVNKTGHLIQVELDIELYKKCGFRSDQHFGPQTEWADQSDTVTLYAKTKGKAGAENKYEFPPPADTELFFGKCLLVNKTGPLTVARWKQIHETLMGGFEDLHSETESEDEVKEGVKYSHGYEVDDFVVEDELEEEPYLETGV